jgi:uncharacterized protein YbaA (DUF1428 family)
MPELSGGDLSLFFSAEADTGLGLKLEQRRVRLSRRIIRVELCGVVLVLTRGDPHTPSVAFIPARRSTPMSYIDGFVIAVPKGNKQKFIEHAKRGDSVFIEHGANRVLECWDDDVRDGKLTDFRRAVQAKEDEAVVFSWIEWPSKATRDTAMAKVMNDPRLSPQSNPMPFDGKRMIFGGFAPVLELGSRT